jgi:acetyltransferase (GNAT) family protein
MVQPELLIVYLVDGRVFGLVLAGFDGFRGWMNRVATHRECQRKGLTCLLVKTAEDNLANDGITEAQSAGTHRKRFGL